MSVGAERLTYGELDRRANQLAWHLRAAGVRPGDRVALLLERSAEMVAAILAVLKTGAAYVPLDPAYPAERLAFTLEDSGASLLLIAGNLAMEGVRTVRLDAERDEIERRSGERLEIFADPDLPAYVIYTSGSTGRPKGVVVTHASVAPPVHGHRALVRLRRGRRLDPLPLLRLRLLGLGDLGGPAPRRPAGRRPLLGQPLARGLLPPAARGAGHRPQPDPLRLPPAHLRRRRRSAERRPTSPCAASSSAARRWSRRASRPGSPATATSARGWSTCTASPRPPST